MLVSNGNPQSIAAHVAFFDVNTFARHTGYSSAVNCCAAEVELRYVCGSNGEERFAIALDKTRVLEALQLSTSEDIEQRRCFRSVRLQQHHAVVHYLHSAFDQRVAAFLLRLIEFPSPALLGVQIDRENSVAVKHNDVATVLRLRDLIVGATDGDQKKQRCDGRECLQF